MVKTRRCKKPQASPSRKRIRRVPPIPPPPSSQNEVKPPVSETPAATVEASTSCPPQKKRGRPPMKKRILDIKPNVEEIDKGVSEIDFEVTNNIIIKHPHEESEADTSNNNGDTTGMPHYVTVTVEGDNWFTENRNTLMAVEADDQQPGPSNACYSKTTRKRRTKKIKVESAVELGSEEEVEENLDSADPEDHDENSNNAPQVSDAELRQLAEMNLFPCPGGTFPAMASAFKSCPVTVQWLLENYETAEGVSLPRSTLYNHYLRHCGEHKLDPVNAASFGKLIRSVFLGLRTRRLGTRGNSKYHYYGIRLKESSALNHLNEDGLLMSPHGASGVIASATKRLKLSKSEGGFDVGHANGFGPIESIVHIQEYLGDHTQALDNFPALSVTLNLPSGIVQEDLTLFRTLYREHCESVQEYVRESDYTFYQHVVQILLPNVLRPIPSAMTQAIRNFAKALEGWLTNVLTGYSEELIKAKLVPVKTLAQTLRRYTSLSHLAQAARAVLQNQGQIAQMIADLNRVDFHSIQEQASWICGCDGEIVPFLGADFKSTLAQQQTLEQWSNWLESVVERMLRPHMGTSNFVQAARHFLLQWSFCSSLIIRDLTLRSAASFGSFHLLHLLYDEYMFYLVEHRVSAATGVVPIAVIGKRLYSDVLPNSSNTNNQRNIIMKIENDESNDFIEQEESNDRDEWLL